MLTFALRNLLSRPLRSLLAIMGLSVAIMGMVGLFSVAEGLDNTVRQTFGRLTGLVAMQPGAPIPLFSRIPSEWVAEIAAVPGVRVVRPEVWTRAHVVEGRPTFNPPRFIFGADIPGTLKLREAIYRDDLIEGRFLEVSDQGTNACLISRAIAGDIHKSVGDVIRVDGNELQIVGIYQTSSIFLDVAIIIDQKFVREKYHIEDELVSSIYIEADGTVGDEQLTETLRTKFKGRSLGAWRPSTDAALGSPASGGGSTTALSGLPAELMPRSWQQAAARLARLFAAAAAEGASNADPEVTTDSKTTSVNGGLTNNPSPPGSTGEGRSATSGSGADDGLEVRSAAAWGARIQEFSADLDVFLYLMNLIGVVIALLSILNTMLMSVSERMIEFGVLKANGWSSRQLMLLIACESAILGVIGGLVGCGLGWLGAQIVNAVYVDKLSLYASPGLLFNSWMFSVVLGVVGGLYPAWWTTRMTPMEAIRRG